MYMKSAERTAPIVLPGHSGHNQEIDTRERK